MLKFFYSLFGVGSDVVNVTSGTANNAGNVAASLITFLSAQLLEVAVLKMVLDQFGEKHPLPSNSSKTIRFVREEKLSVTASPTQLTEGVAPDADPITLTQIEATVEQYGKVIRISDLAELTAKHPIVQRTIYMLGLQAAELYDQLIFNVVDAATNNYRPNGRSADTDLLASDVVGYNDLVELSALMADQGAQTFMDNEYIFVTPPQTYASLQKDPDYKASHQLAKPEAIWKGEVDELAGFRIVKTNAPAFAATTQATSGKTNKVYSSFALGRAAYQITDLQNLQFYQTPPGGHTDPLYQSRKMGWKFAFKAVITNQNWIRRVRSSGANSANNA